MTKTPHDRSQYGVLVIHREQVIGEIIVEILLAAGYECRGAWQEPDISRMLDSVDRCDVLFLHIRALEDYPELEAKTVLRRARQPKIVLTAARPRSAIPKQLLDRADVYLAVPFDPEQLVSVIQDMVNRHGSPSS